MGRVVGVASTSDPTEALHRPVTAMGWQLEEGAEGFTLAMPNGDGRTTHRDAASALTHLSYVATWRKDAEELRARVNWTGSASDLLEGPQGGALRWLPRA